MLRERIGAFLERTWGLSNEERTGLFVLLRPLSSAYGAIQRIRRALYRTGLLGQRKLPCPVVSVGALRVGGSGKTPFALWLCQRLAEKGWRPAVLTRGYGRRPSPGTQILLHDQIETEDPLETGDEPYLLARSLPDVPVVVDANRYRGGCKALARQNVDVFVLDDGFQHLRLARDCDIVLIGSEMERPGPLCLPAGPLREPPHALRDAQVLVYFSDVSREQSLPASWTPDTRTLPSCATLLHAVLRPAGLFTLEGKGPLDASTLRGEGVYAFCAIGRPESFWRTLERMGIDVSHRETFPDHHPYSVEDFRRILRQLGLSRRAVTTEKDAVKIARFPWPPERILSLRITVQVHEEERFWQVLSHRLGSHQGRDGPKCA